MKQARRRRSVWIVSAAALIAAACSAGSESAGESGPNTIGRAAQSVDTAAPLDTAAVASTVAPATTATPATTETPATTGAPVSTTAPGTDTPVDGTRSLVWGVDTPDPSSGLDPVFALSFGEYAVLAQVFDHLTSVNELGVFPSLATDWQTNDDATVWTFFLRDDVVFHDGLPLVAEDVVWSLNRAIESGVGGVSEAVEPGSVIATDALTIELTTTGPNLELPTLVSNESPGTAIVPDGIISDQDFLIGTGPFRLVGYDAGTSAEFEAHDEWWAGTPTIDELTLRFFDRSDVMATALEAGEIDGIANVSQFNASRLLDNDDLTLGTATARNHRQIWMRTDAGPFADVRVREAFALSIDRQALVDELWGPFARVGNDHVIEATNPGFDDSIVQRTQDDEAAANLLSEAGFADGLSATIYVPDLAEIPDLAELIAEQASSAGFQFDVFILDAASFYEFQWCPGIREADSDTPCGDNADIGIVDYGHRPTDAIFLSRPLLSTGDWNASNFIDETYDGLYNTWRGASTASDASAGLQAIQQHLTTNVPVVIPYFYDVVYAHQANISSVGVSALGQPALAFAEFADD